MAMERTGPKFVQEQPRLIELCKKELKEEKKWAEIRFRQRIGEQRSNNWTKMAEAKAGTVLLRARDVQMTKKKTNCKTAAKK